MADISEILTKLLVTTDEGKVDWKPTADERAFTASIGNVAVVILTDREGDPILRILDHAGREIDKLEGWDEPGSRFRSNLFELHTKARRIALDVDSQLDELLKSLETST